ncbi:hypothetical protein Salat_1383000 [Sesamum alatum]|uniref:Uncharacterized protein n=1 Tax=Sesamum alatum TaxID=300844 RepID=A0AAE1Y9D9_9LAMI|nr:hypothetical protein Salat_1383000 [Sesamum alatum]
MNWRAREAYRTTTDNISPPKINAVVSSRKHLLRLSSAEHFTKRRISRNSAYSPFLGLQLAKLGHRGLHVVSTGGECHERGNRSMSGLGRESRESAGGDWQLSVNACVRIWSE